MLNNFGKPRPDFTNGQRFQKLSVEDAAAGVIELLDLQLHEYLRSNVAAKGYSPSDFVCFSYGGAGPVHT